MNMWKRALKGEVNQDVTSYKHIITSTFHHGALPFSGYPAPENVSGDFVLIERKSHTALYDMITLAAEEKTRDKVFYSYERSYRKYVLIGPPGIGKSCSLNLVFLRCAALKEVSEGSERRRKPVIVCDRTVYGEGYRYLIFTPGSDPKVEVSSAEPAALNDRKNIYLYAPPHAAGGDKQVHICDAFTVIASSPNRANYDGVRNAAAKIFTYRWEPEEAMETEKALGLQANPTAVERCGFSLRLLTGGKQEEDIMERDLHVALNKVDNAATLRKMMNATSTQRGALLFWSNRLFTLVSPKMGDKLEVALKDDDEKDGAEEDEAEEDDPKRFLDFDVWPVSEYARRELERKVRGR